MSKLISKMVFSLKLMARYETSCESFRPVNYDGDPERTSLLRAIDNGRKTAAMMTRHRRHLRIRRISTSDGAEERLINEARRRRDAYHKEDLDEDYDNRSNLMLSTVQQ